MFDSRPESLHWQGIGRFARRRSDATIGFQAFASSLIGDEMDGTYSWGCCKQTGGIGTKMDGHFFQFCFRVRCEKLEEGGKSSLAQLFAELDTPLPSLCLTAIGSKPNLSRHVIPSSVTPRIPSSEQPLALYCHMQKHKGSLGHTKENENDTKSTYCGLVSRLW